MYRHHQIAHGGPGGAAALSLDNILRYPASALPRPGFGKASAGGRGRARRIVDLGDGIGTPDWLRGLATCTILCLSAWAFAPGLAAIPGASPPAWGDAQWDEAQALAIAPLALGADSGRRMAASDLVEPLADIPERPSVDLVATLGRGDGFARVLERAGVAPAEAGSVARMVADVVGPGEIRAGTRMALTLGRRPNRMVARPLDALAFRARFDLKLAVTRSEGGLRLERTPIAVDHTPLRIQGRIGSSLYRAARAAGAPAKAVEAYIRAVAGQVGIGSLGAADRFDIIVEHRRAATGESETGRLLYAGLDRSGGKDLQLLHWNQSGKMQWFEASGVGKTSGSLQRPVPGNVSSSFGMRRHPILGYSRMHKGMDFRAGFGTPILAASDGRVTAAGWAGGYGRQVRITHAGGISTSYSHMSRIAARSGSQVRQGQVIGYVGSTGLSTGPHLHYELYRNGVPVNPNSVRFVMRSQLSGADLAAFRARLRNLLAVPSGPALPSRVAASSGGSRPAA